MNLKKTLLGLSLLGAFLQAQILPVEKSLITGQLENGLKYTIKKNTKPAKTAQFRLLVKAGSLEEDDDQKGIAHLVEHMAFNGTENFKGNELIKFLESIGVAFGSHLNASTSTERTLYKLEVPMKNDNLEKSMLIFSDWASKINFTQKELDKERGVVLEEKRSRHNLGFRMYLQAKDVIYHNSKYMYRTPIGDADIIKNISLERVKDFYDTWYRPELMHFVAVGDFDVKEVEKLIIERFSSLKNKNHRKQASRFVPKTKGTRVLVLSDEELSSSRLSVDYFSSYTQIKTENDYKNAVIKSIMMSLFNAKAGEQILKNNPAASSMFLRSRQIGSDIDIFSFTATFEKSNEYKALKELNQLIYKMNKFGFNKNEFERVKNEYRISNKESIKSLNNKTSARYADTLAGYALKDTIFIDEKFKIKLLDKLLNEITLDDINLILNEVLRTNSKLITYQITKDTKVNKQEILKVFKISQEVKQTKEKTKTLPKRIKIENLKEAKIVKETYDKKYDFYEFILDNKIKVVYKFNDYTKNTVFLTASSKGGYSLYEDNKVSAARYAPSIVMNSGLASFDILELSKIYSQNNAKISMKINRYGEMIEGRSSSKDFEILLERLHLRTTKFQMNDTIFSNAIRRSLNNLEKSKNVPKQRFSKEYKEFLFNNNKRFTKTSMNDIENITKKDLLKIYEDRFSDLNNFTFIIVGDIKKDEVKKYIKKYFANLPTNTRIETYKFRGIKPLKGEQTFIRNYNNQNISSISLSYLLEKEYSLEESVKLQALTDILKTKLRELIREEKSGVYGVSVRSYFAREPYSNVNIRISFTCDPKRKDELVRYIKQSIEDIKNNLVEKKYLSAFVKKRLNALKQSEKSAAFWINTLKKHYYYNDSMDLKNNYKTRLEGLSIEDIKNSANTYLSTNNILYTQLNPKK